MKGRWCFAVGLLMMVGGAGSLAAQTVTEISGHSEPDSARAGASARASVHATPLPLPFKGGPLVTGINVWAGSATSVRTASHNERVNGSLSMLGVQFTRTLFVAKGVQFSWMIEVVPVMLATVEAPPNRLPSPQQNSAAYYDRQQFKRYTMHDVYGFGLSPFSAEATKAVSDKLTTVVSVTSGGAIFSAVIPYGKATRANFTVSPGIALEWRASASHAIAFGYTLHHLSNASFGEANPGMNSHIIFARVSRARFATGR